MKTTPIEPLGPLAGMKLGKLPYKPDPRTLRLADYITAELPAAQEKEDWFSAIQRPGMMLNDRIGDCVVAGAGHMIQSWTANNAKEVVITDKEILRVYSYLSGYNPATGENDNGLVLLDLLKHWQSKGIGGHKIGAFVSVSVQNREHVKLAIQLFGGAYLGVGLPLSAQRQRTWDVPTRGTTGEGAPGSWGGHCVTIPKYSPLLTGVFTWGKIQKATWGFIQTYADEVWAILSTDWVNKKMQAPSGFDLAALQADLNAIRKR